MEKYKYVIRSKDKPGKYLAGLGIGSCNPLFPDVWTSFGANAIHCTNTEAKAIIDFVTYGINRQLGESLYIEKHTIKEPWEEKY